MASFALEGRALASAPDLASDHWVSQLRASIPEEIPDPDTEPED
jgi:hypothetical protein